MRTFSKKQKFLVAGAAALVIAGTAGAAFAYWSSTGTGSGSATTGTSTAFAITTEAATGGPLSPGGPSESVLVHVNNPSTGHQQLAGLTVSVADAAGNAWTAVSGCSAADYTVTVPAVTATDLAPGATYETTATISMNNLATNQDGCKGATVPLYFVAN